MAIEVTTRPLTEDDRELLRTATLTHANSTGEQRFPSRVIDEVLGPDDDIVLFEYVKRDNRETGAALTGIELGSAADFPALLARIETSPLRIQHVAPGTTAYRFLV